MGELADRYRRWIDQPRSVGEGREMWSILDAIERLERRCADVEKRLPHVESIERIYEDLGTRNDQLHAQLNSDVADVEKLSTRLAAAEQRAAAAWAAVTELLAANGEIAAIADVDEVSDRHDSSGWRCQLVLSNATNIPEFRRHKLRVAVIEPLSASRNPDLLERASVELAEAYQRAKAEEQRQAEEKAAVATMKCQPTPDDRGYKTIGLCHCPDCGNTDCWPHYLTWEKHRGIGMNADLYSLVVESWPERSGRSIAAAANPSTATSAADTVTR